MEKINLKTLTRPELIRFVESLGEKPFRASQIWWWMYRKGAGSFDAMTNLSSAFRERLSRAADLRSIVKEGEIVSRRSGTRKFLWRLEDGVRIESVFIPEGNRKTVCISSQAGCALGCTFCATGGMGFIRNLHFDEIVDQVVSVGRETGVSPTNVVVMGMGEPFLNYDNVLKAMDVLNDPEGMAIGHRKITISTAGIVPRIRQYAGENRPFRLAVSLNAVRDDLRDRLMPVNRSYPLDALLDAVRGYTRMTRKRVTFEYVLLDGVNDSPMHAEALFGLLKGFPCKINLIAYNPGGGPFGRPAADRVETFASRLKPLWAPVILRLSRGDDIGAACGQLASPAPSSGPLHEESASPSDDP